MLEIRPVGYVIGWLVAGLGASMTLPMLVGLIGGAPDAQVFATTAILTIVSGAVLALACASERARPMGIQESFLLAVGVWAVFPIFAALPIWLALPQATVADGFFEAMSALTTTGATVLTGLDGMSSGMLLWRGMLQWFGGLGIVVVAMVFLPALKVGGMQIFKSEAFDTMGKMLPRAGAIALSLTGIYLSITFACFMAYTFTGLDVFDAAVHAMTTVATGGMANYDASFAAFGAATQYVAIAFMIAAALPFVRYMQLSGGSLRPMLRDTQVQAFLLLILVVVGLLVGWRALATDAIGEAAFREVLFSVVSITTGTGYAVADYNLWGPFAVTVIFVIGLVGGCSGSTACSVKIFRYQLMLSAVSAELQRLYSANRVQAPRYEGRTIAPEVLDSVMAFFMMFFLTLAIVAVLLVLIGLEPITAISGAAAALANIGPGLGPEIGPVGSYADIPEVAKWLLAATMLIGRLELMSVFVLFTPSFWRA